MNKKSSVYSIAVGGLLTAVMLVLGYVEYLIPLGGAVPGVKLGLSNSVLLYALYVLGVRQTFLLMVMKVFLSGFLFGGVNAMMYSLAGGLCSMLAMILVKRIPKMGVLGVSVSGAVFHNAGQIALAMIILKTDKLLYYMALLILAGVGTGVLTGVIAGLVTRALKGNGPGRRGP